MAQGGRRRRRRGEGWRRQGKRKKGRKNEGRSANENRPDRVSLYTLHNTPLFFQHMDDAIMPHLTLVHKYPTLFPRLRIDRGAIRFVLSGATLMTPGLTSPGGRLPNAPEDAEKRYGDKELEKGEVVVVEAEGKENACFVGVLRIDRKSVV